MGVTNSNIGFIGAGRMASAIIGGILDSGFLPKSSVFAYDVNQDTLKYISKNLKIGTCSSVAELLETCPIVVVATKPFVVGQLLDEMQDKVRNHLVISILAGIQTKKFEAKLQKTRVIRVMPNTPALVGEGMTAVCAGKYAFENDINYVVEMFSKLGRAVIVDEKQMDLVTAISGSGPAFYYYIIDKIAKAGERLGMDYKLALELSVQTARGAAEMIMKTPNSPQELIDAVTTPGGTTEIGNNILINSDVEGILFKTIKRTMEKSKKLGG